VKKPPGYFSDRRRPGRTNPACRTQKRVRRRTERAEIGKLIRAHREDADGQREASAVIDETVGCLAVRLDPLDANGRGEQRDRVLLRKLVEGNPLRALRGDQCAELPAARDQYQETWAGQQRADLFGAGRVLEQDEQPPPRVVGSPERGATVEIARDPVAGTPSEVSIDSSAAAGSTGSPGPKPRRFTEILTAGKPVRHLVREVDGEGGLADAAHAFDGGDRRRPASVGGALTRKYLLDQCAEGLEVGVTSGESAEVRGQLARNERFRADQVAADSSARGESSACSPGRIE
jgi:hypothetical protein